MPIQTQEIQKTPTRLNQKRKFPQHIIIKKLNIQNKRILKATKEKTE